MSISAAKDYYLGKDGFKRMNCAQSVICAFKEKFNISEDTVELFRAYGGGNAPGGLCGAYYAAKYMLEKGALEGKTNELEKYFLECAGAIKCRDIKSGKKLSCLGCVEKSSEFLEKIHQE